MYRRREKDGVRSLAHRKEHRSGYIRANGAPICTDEGLEGKTINGYLNHATVDQTSAEERCTVSSARRLLCVMSDVTGAVPTGDGPRSG